MSGISTSLPHALLACGVLAPSVYAATDIVASMRWVGYSFRDQTISELNAIGAPTRSLTIVLGLIGYVMLTAFAVGVWRSAEHNPRLRAAGGVLLAFGVLALWSVPFASMNLRGVDRSLGDTLHLAGGALAVTLLLVTIALSASAFGAGFRVYSIATVLVLLAFGGWTAVDAGRIAADLPTPWVGIKERTSVYAYQAWLIVFAIIQLRNARSVAP